MWADDFSNSKLGCKLSGLRFCVNTATKLKAITLEYVEQATFYEKDVTQSRNDI